MAPRPKQTQPPAPPITLPPPGSAKKSGAVAPVGSIAPPITIPPPGSANKSKTTTIPSIGPTKVPGTSQTTNLSGIDQAELVEIYRKANQALANAQRFGIPDETAQQILDTGQRPDTGFATFVPGLKATGGFLKRAAGFVLPDVLDVSDIPLPGTAKNLGGAIKGVGERVLFGTDAGTAEEAKKNNELEKRKFSVASITSPPYKLYQAGYRSWVGLLKEAGDELDVWTGKAERGEEQFYPLPPEYREKIGPGGIFRGGPKGLESLDVPRESRGKAGFQWSELIATAKDPETGIGNTLWRDVTGNAYVDQLVGAFGEVFADPFNLASAGVGGTAVKTAGKAAGLAPDAFRAAELASDALRAQGKAAIAREAALEALDAAKAAGKAAEVTRAQKAVDSATQALKQATADVKGPKAPRVRGRDGAGALAQRLVDQRADALKVIEDAKTNPSLYAPEQIGLANYTVDIITDEIIAKTASRGFAGLIPGLGAAFKATTPVESLLGVSGRLRVGLGGKMVEIPGTERLTRPITYGIQGTREGIASRVGIGAIVPTGEGGIFTSGLRRERADLRTGAAGPETAGRSLELQAIDRAFRGNRVRFVRDSVSTLARYGLTRRFQPGKIQGKARNIAKTLGKDVPADAGYTKKDLNSVLPFVTDATKRGAAKLSESQTKALAAIQGSLADFFKQSEEIGGQTGRKIGFIDNYFPQMLSDEALAAIRSGGKPATDAAKNLKINDLEARGNFTRRTLEEGEDFFGRELTAEDIAGGVIRLNQIAKDGGWKYGKFFEEDVLSVLYKYANRHADDMARQTTLAQAPAIAPKQFARELETSKKLIIGAFEPDRAKSSFRTYAERKAAGVAGADTARVDEIIDKLSTNIDEIVAMGTDDASAAVLQDNLLRAANLDLNEVLYGLKDSPFDLSLDRFSTAKEIMDRGFVSIGDAAPDVYADPRVLELFKTVKTLTGDPEYTKAVLAYYDQKLGFMKSYMLATPRNVALNVVGNLYMMTMAGGAKMRNIIEGRNIYKQILDMARDGVPIDDAVRTVSAKLKPRGALDRPAQLRAAPTEAEADLLRRMGLPVPEQQLAPTGKVDDLIQQAVADAYAQYGGTGYGRYGEIGAEVGADTAKTGAFLKGPAKGLTFPEEIRLPGGYKAIPLRPSGMKSVQKFKKETTVGRKLAEVGQTKPVKQFKKGFEFSTDAIEWTTRKGSETVGSLATTTRRVAQSVEDAQRFEFMWDGLRQGLTPEEAVARVKYYLFDYQDMTKLDVAGKRLFPFWMWMSRNTPLQLAVATYNPRAYAFPEKFRRATEDRDAQKFGSGFQLPPYMVDRGAFVTKDMGGFGQILDNPLLKVVDPGLPIVGFGEKNFFTEFLTNYEGGIIGPLTPAVRLPMELYANRIAAFRDPIVYENDVDPTSKRIEYAFRQSFGMPISLFSRYIATIPYARRQEVIQQAFELRYDENQPGDQALGAAFRILGFPFQPAPRQSVTKAVSNNNMRELQNFVKDVETGLKREQQKVLDDAVKKAEEKLKQLGPTP
jgi:hypothetical protein